MPKQVSLTQTSSYKHHPKNPSPKTTLSTKSKKTIQFVVTQALDTLAALVDKELACHTRGIHLYPWQMPELNGAKGAREITILINRINRLQISRSHVKPYPDSVYYAEWIAAEALNTTPDQLPIRDAYGQTLSKFSFEDIEKATLAFAQKYLPPIWEIPWGQALGKQTTLPNKTMSLNEFKRLYASQIIFLRQVSMYLDAIFHKDNKDKKTALIKDFIQKIFPKFNELNWLNYTSEHFSKMQTLIEKLQPIFQAFLTATEKKSEEA